MSANFYEVTIRGYEPGSFNVGPKRVEAPTPKAAMYMILDSNLELFPDGSTVDVTVKDLQYNAFNMKNKRKIV